MEFRLQGIRLGYLGNNLRIVDPILIPGNHPPFHQINKRTELVFGTYWKLQGNRIGAEAFLHAGHRLVEISADTVHFIDEGNPGDAVPLRLTPDRLGLGLNTRYRAKDRHRTVQDTQTPLDFSGKINVSRGINNIDMVPLPLAGCGGRRNGYTALPLLLHEVHGSGAVMDFAHAVHPAGVVQEPFSNGGLAGINMSHYADVAHILDGYCTGHVLYFPKVEGRTVRPQFLTKPSGYRVESSLARPKTGTHLLRNYDPTLCLIQLSECTAEAARQPLAVQRVTLRRM
ncbi:MAG: hypothetical protein BWY09_02344 [Candidatus Hydrogenedentes bacterium ADurb.Bin179]|nr:MAG: hypothetical protein BWY09_02344 [Candidatus Hydrogenedentes bacterium ADurb.Bin179]